MLRTDDKSVKRDASDTFKLVQMYMRDRKPTGKYTSADSNSNSSRVSSGGGGGDSDSTEATLKGGPAAVAMEIALRGWSSEAAMRDEIYMQLCRQTSNNKRVSVSPVVPGEGLFKGARVSISSVIHSLFKGTCNSLR